MSKDKKQKDVKDEKVETEVPETETTETEPVEEVKETELETARREASEYRKRKNRPPIPQQRHRLYLHQQENRNRKLPSPRSQ